MHVVALTRWGAAMDGELPVLAVWLGVTAYDLRLRLAGALPVVFALKPDAQSAEDFVARLRARSHGAVSCDATQVPGPGDQIVPREFELFASALRGKDDHGRPFELPYVEITGLIRAARVSNTQNTLTTKETKFDMGMAVMSGGLKMSKQIDKVERSGSEEREQTLHIFRRSRPEPLLCRELALRYQSLGAALKPTTAQNFATFVELLRARAPFAFHDQRLVTQKRKAGALSIAGPAKERSVATTNAGETDLAAALLMLAHEQGQL